MQTGVWGQMGTELLKRIGLKNGAASWAVPRNSDDAKVGLKKPTKQKAFCGIAWK